jgi:hypothetical protein
MEEHTGEDETKGRRCLANEMSLTGRTDKLTQVDPPAFSMAIITEQPSTTRYPNDDEDFTTFEQSSSTLKENL